jgi:hypothetical protein
MESLGKIMILIVSFKILILITMLNTLLCSCRALDRDAQRNRMEQRKAVV